MFILFSKAPQKEFSWYIFQSIEPKKMTGNNMLFWNWYLLGVTKVSSCADKTGSWYLLGVLFKISDEYPSFLYRHSPRGKTGNHKRLWMYHIASIPSNQPLLMLLLSERSRPSVSMGYSPTKQQQNKPHVEHELHLAPSHAVNRQIICLFQA